MLRSTLPAYSPSPLGTMMAIITLLTLFLKTHFAMHNLRWVNFRQCIVKLITQLRYVTNCCFIQECHNDTRPEAATLRQQRIRTYRTTRTIHQDGCQTSNTYRVESYLIIDNAGEEDGGEYTLNVTVMSLDFKPIPGLTVVRSVNTSISMCRPALCVYDCACIYRTLHESIIEFPLKCTRVRMWWSPPHARVCIA